MAIDCGEIPLSIVRPVLFRRTEQLGLDLFIGRSIIIQNITPANDMRIVVASAICERKTTAWRGSIGSC